MGRKHADIYLASSLRYLSWYASYYQHVVVTVVLRAFVVTLLVLEVHGLVSDVTD